jgi:hypothetical protein
MWVRDVFTGLFEQEPQSMSNYLEEKKNVQQLKSGDTCPCSKC